MTRNRWQARCEDFTIAILCALESEANAIQALFELTYNQRDVKGIQPHNETYYSFGRIGAYYVVLTFLPGKGKLNSSLGATNTRHNFRNIELTIVVGVCGGVPVKGKEGDRIFLGDVIIGE